MQRRGRGSSSRQVESNWSSDRRKDSPHQTVWHPSSKGGRGFRGFRGNGRIAPAALIPLLPPQKTSLWAARGEFPAPGIIRQIRWIREIRVPTLNLDASPDNPGTSNGT